MGFNNTPKQKYIKINHFINQVFKTLKIDGLPRSMQIREKQSEVVIGTKEGFVKFIEYETGIERDKISLSNDSIKNIEFCLPK